MSALFYLVVLVLLVGVGRKIVQYATTPAPLKIPTTPAPTTRLGVVWRMFKEVVFFESLFKASKITWIFGWLFHASLLLVLLYHLQFFTEPVWNWVWLLVPLFPYASFAMLIGLLGLLLRRIVVDRVRVISAPSDYLMLLLIISIASSGLLMRYFWYPNIVAVKQFAIGLLSFEFAPFPGGFVLLMHLLLVALLLFIYPFSKLLHAPGLFFSPTRHQVDNARERRYTSAVSDHDPKA